MARGLSERQRGVLGALEKERKSVGAVLDDCKVTEGEFSRWLDQVAFRRALRGLRRRVRLRRELELERGGAMAARVLGEAAAGAHLKFLREGQHRACESIVKLARAAGKGKILKKEFAAGQRGEVWHPSLGPYGRKVMLELEAMKREDERREDDKRET